MAVYGPQFHVSCAVLKVYVVSLRVVSNMANIAGTQEREPK